MEDKLSDQQMRQAMFKLAVENNALLRVMLNNQVQIMKKLEVPPHLTVPFIEAIGDEPESSDAILRLHLQVAEKMESGVTKRAWNWAVEHDVSDNE